MNYRVCIPMHSFRELIQYMKECLLINNAENNDIIENPIFSSPVI